MASERSSSALRLGSVSAAMRLLDLLGGGEALAATALDRFGFVLLALVGLARAWATCRPSSVQVLLHGAEFRLGGGFGVPAHDGLDARR